MNEATIVNPPPVCTISDPKTTSTISTSSLQRTVALFRTKVGPVHYVTMPPSRSRSQSRHRVDRAQRCRMLRRFHKHLADQPDGEQSNIHLFTDEMLKMIDSLVGDDGWEAAPEGEAPFDDKWWNSRSLTTQLVYVRRWYAEGKPLPASDPSPDQDAATSSTTEAHPLGSDGKAAETELGSSGAAATMPTITNDAATVTNDAAPSPSNLDLTSMLNQREPPSASPLRSSPAWWESGKPSGRQAATPTVTQPSSTRPPVTQHLATQPAIANAMSAEEEAEERELRRLEVDLVKVKKEYNMIPKEYHDWLMSRKAASLAHGVFREAEKSCKITEGAVSAAEGEVAEADRRLREATLQVFGALGAAPTDGDHGRLSTRSLTDAQRKMLEDANEAAHRAAAGDIAGVISGVARLNLGRREIKEERNGLYDAWRASVEVHQGLHNDMVAKEAAFKAAEDEREAAWKRWEHVRQSFFKNVAQQSG
ncbi:hypothetical protein CcaCcLH18_12148 [Colletotrichum camelliae]|nr:hypothetical protein CcaCcLH18_12148 [Colletotrichum camelliae]